MWRRVGRGILGRFGGKKEKVEIVLQIKNKIKNHEKNLNF